LTKTNETLNNLEPQGNIFSSVENQAYFTPKLPTKNKSRR